MYNVVKLYCKTYVFKSMQKKTVTICSCSSRAIINKEKVIETASALKNAGYCVNIVPDLCKTAVSEPEKMEGIADSVVIACYTRAVESLFGWLGLNPKQMLDIRNNNSSEILSLMNIPESENNTEFRELLDTFAPETGNDAWFPVIDKNRCSECGECHDFCLFGVYEYEKGKVKVSQPRNCKNNCPACARVCPQKAVIFPKYEKSPINGGINDEEQAVTVDTKALYTNALRLKLEQRKTGISLLKNNKK